MRKINIGLIGFGTVGSGVVQFLQKRKTLIQKRYQVQFQLKTVCDLYIDKLDTRSLKNVRLTKNYHDILDDPEIDVVVELIGGTHPALEIVSGALNQGKNVVTANKALISSFGKELFALAQKKNRHLYFESSVGAGVPIIKTLTEGLVGNTFNGVYGIVNGTCNYILSVMKRHNYSFERALKDAQKKGYAESDPTLDINGMDSAHKLAILVYLAFGKFIPLKSVYTEGITDISAEDIENADHMDLTIKLLAIAKKDKNQIEARVHPTLIPKNHPLASINDVLNAIYLIADPLGDVLLSGEGAGQMAAASGVISDLINFAAKTYDTHLYCNLYDENPQLKIKKIDAIETKFYIRFMAIDKPGVLSRISGVLGKHNISINSVTQKAHNRRAAVPVIMLTDYTSEKNIRLALKAIQKLPIVKSKPVAIRMETLS